MCMRVWEGGGGGGVFGLAWSSVFSRSAPAKF